MTHFQSSFTQFQTTKPLLSAVPSQWIWNEQTPFAGDLVGSCSHSDVQGLTARYLGHRVSRCSPPSGLMEWMQLKCSESSGRFGTGTIGTSDERSAIATNCNCARVDPFVDTAHWNHSTYVDSRLQILILLAQPLDEIISFYRTASCLGDRSCSHVSSK